MRELILTTRKFRVSEENIKELISSQEKQKKKIEESNKRLRGTKRVKITFE